MYIEKQNYEERVYSVLMNEAELRLYSEYLEEREYVDKKQKIERLERRIDNLEERIKDSEDERSGSTWYGNAAKNAAIGGVLGGGAGYGYSRIKDDIPEYEEKIKDKSNELMEDVKGAAKTGKSKAKELVEDVKGKIKKFSMVSEHPFVKSFASLDDAKDWYEGHEDEIKDTAIGAGIGAAAGAIKGGTDNLRKKYIKEPKLRRKVRRLKERVKKLKEEEED